MRFLNLILLLLSLFIFTNGYAEEEDSGKDLQQIYHISNDLNLVPTTKFFYGKSKIVIKAVYPEIKSEIIEEEPDENAQNFNNIVLSFVQEEVNKFKKQVADDMPQGLAKAAIKNDLSIDFNTSAVNATNDPILSIRFSVQGYVAGMAHPFEYHRVLNFDLATGKELQLAELFKPDANYLAVIAEYSKDSLSKRFKDKQMVEQGTMPTAENYKNWNVNPHGLLITFDKAQVAPSVFGTQTVLIPYAKLDEILAADTGIEACVKHPKKCQRNNILTGGFLDQAVNTKHGTFNPPLGTV